MFARPVYKPFIVSAFAFLSLTCIEPASASDVRLDLAGQVPVMCRAEIDRPSGRIEEFCNNAAGFEVYLDHGPLPAPARVTVDGVDIALSGAASTLISRSDRAVIRSRSIAFEVPPGSQLVLRVVPR